MRRMNSLCANRDEFRFARPILWALLLGACLVAAPLARAQESGPLVLAKSSYFFVGGKIDTAIEGSPMVGQMYVEYMIPQRLLPILRAPVVMVHGGQSDRHRINHRHARTAAKAGRNFSCAVATRSMWWIRWRAAVPPIGARSMDRCRPRGSPSWSSALWRPS